MSRHRNIRSMNINEEYEGYDDVYGHSVEDDYSVSPSEAAFMYDREGSKNKQKIGAFLQTVTDIAEENEGEAESKEATLSDIDKARLESCIEQIKQIVGGAVSRQDLVNIIFLYNFNIEKAINFILGCPQYRDIKLAEKKDDILTKKSVKSFTIPKLSATSSKLPMTFKREPLKIDSANFSSLNELSKSHLQSLPRQTDFTKINFSVKPPFGKKTSVDALACDVSKIDIVGTGTRLKEQLASLQSKSKVTDDSVLDNYHIDLTKALRGVNSAPQLRSNQIQVNLEAFTPTFIDCETIMPRVIPSDCDMNISMKLSKRKIKFKEVSKFGRVLCFSYTRPTPNSVRHSYESSSQVIAQFLFDCPSPDDIRSRALHKHLKLHKS